MYACECVRWDNIEFCHNGKFWLYWQNLIEKYAIIAEFRMFEAIWDKAKDKEGIKGVNF